MALVRVYVAAGPTESSTDLAFDADAFIASEVKSLSSQFDSIGRLNSFPQT